MVAQPPPTSTTELTLFHSIQYTPLHTFFAPPPHHPRNLLAWAKSYAKIPPQPFPKKCRGVNLGLKALVEHVVSIEKFTIKVDKFLLSVGGCKTVCAVRAGPFTAQLSMRRHAKNEPLPDPFKTGYVLVTEKTWFVHDINFALENCEGTVNDEFLFSLDRLTCSSRKTGLISDNHDDIYTDVNEVSERNTASEPFRRREIRATTKLTLFLIFWVARLPLPPAPLKMRTISLRFASLRSAQAKKLDARIRSMLSTAAMIEEDEYLFKIRATSFKVLIVQQTNEALARLGVHMYGEILDLLISPFEPSKVLKKYLKDRKGERAKHTKTNFSSANSFADSQHSDSDEDEEAGSNAEFLRQRFAKTNQSKSISTHNYNSAKFFFNNNSR